MQRTGDFITFLVAVSTMVTADMMPEIHSDPPATLRATLRKFSKPRHHVTNPRNKERTRKLIKKVFKQSGWEVWSEDANVTPSLRGENIVGMLRGKNSGTAEDKIVIVGAHYDTTSKSRGVDDNGSGVTALLQVAKHVGRASCILENTVMLVAFDFEEDTIESKYPIPFGSEWFVRNLTKYIQHTGGTVKGSLILEMLANHNTAKGSQKFPRWFSYISPRAYKEVQKDGNRGNFLAVIGRREADKVLMEPLKKFYSNDNNFKLHLIPIPLSGRPTKSKHFKYYRDYFRSDHYNFWENSISFPAVMLTDTSNYRTPMDKCYHRKCDSMRLIGKNDLEFLRRNIDAVIQTTLQLSKAGFCRTKFHRPVKTRLLPNSNTIVFKDQKLLFEESDAVKEMLETRQHDDKTLDTSYAQAIPSTTTAILIVIMNCAFLLR